MKKIYLSLSMVFVLLFSLGTGVSENQEATARHYDSPGLTEAFFGFFDSVSEWFNYYYGDDYYDDDYYDDYYDDDNYYDDDDNYYDDDDYYEGEYDEAYYDEYYNYYDEEVLAVYLVEDGDFEWFWGDVTDSEEELYEQIWDQASAIIPDDYEYLIDKFEVATDGKDGTVGYVYNVDNSLTTWIFSLDPSDSVNRSGNFKSDYETIIHEFGHLLTLNYTQMNSSAKNTYVTDEGTLDTDSYLNLFYQEFWVDIIDEYNREVDPDDEDEVYDFYLDHSDMFVTDYAATNPEEDIAESFMVFVTEDYPSGDDIMDQKVQFFYEFEELVEVRDEIIERMN